MVEKVFINGALPAPPHGEPVRAGRLARLVAVVYFIIGTIPTALGILLTGWLDRGHLPTSTFMHYWLRARTHFIGPHADEHNTFEGIIITSHKSWGDFAAMSLFGMAATMARLAVAAAMPFIWLANLTCHVIFFFRRGGRSKEGRERFTKDILAFFHQNPRLLVYAEGTRAHRRGALRLRSGMLRIAFDAEEPIPVMVAPMEGCQYLFNERTGAFVRTRVPVVICCQAVFDPRDYTDKGFDAFYQDITEAFTTGYAKAVAEYDRLATNVRFWPWVRVTHDAPPSNESHETEQSPSARAEESAADAAAAAATPATLLAPSPQLDNDAEENN